MKKDLGESWGRGGRPYKTAIAATAMILGVGGATVGTKLVQRPIISGSQTTIADGYVRLSVQGVNITSLQFDPSGQGHYGANAIISAAPAGVDLAVSPKWVRTGPEALALEQTGAGGNTPFYSVVLKGPTLMVQYQNTAYLPGWTMNLPWKIAGYITKLRSPYVPFEQLLTSEGQVIPAQLLKRTTSLPEGVLASSWVELQGTHGYNLKVSASPGISSVAITAGENPYGESNNVLSPTNDMLALNFDPTTAATDQSLKIQVQPQSAAMLATAPVFETSKPWVTEYLNRFYDDKAYENPPSSIPTWQEWESLIFDWTNVPMAKLFEQGVVDTYEGPHGFVWDWGSTYRYWPIAGDPVHFDSNSHYILGAYRLYTWTRNRSELQQMYPEIEKAMQFQLTQLHGKSGLLDITSDGHTGLNGSPSDNYYDQLPFGAYSAYDNIYFYASLKAMEAIDQVLGYSQQATYYGTLAATCRRDYSQKFWNAKAGRFIEDVNIKGQRIDYGATFVNLEAAGYGLASASQRKAIYHWLDDEPVNSGGLHEPNAYGLFGYMPMLTTIDNTQWYYSTNEPTLPGFTQELQNGGGDLYLPFYDIMDRISTFGPNNAWQYLIKVLRRFSLPDGLAGGTPLIGGFSPQTSSPGAVGVAVPFPEAALPAVSFLSGFLGINATTQGITVQPNLPSDLHHAGVRNLYYDGRYFSIQEAGRRVTLTISSTLIPSGQDQSAKGVVRFSKTIPKGRALLLTGVDAVPKVSLVTSTPLGDGVLP